ncbi:putative disease resistance protein RGA1 [Carex rostrata]
MALSTMASWAGSAVLAIADWAGSSVVENLIGTAYSYLHDHMLPADCEAELKRVQEALPHITAVMDIAEALKTKHPSAGLWVNQFRKAVEASEDVLDELEYRKLEVNGPGCSSKKRKLRSLHDNILESLKEAVTMLDHAAAKSKDLLQLAKTLGICDISYYSWQEAGKVLSRETTSFLAEREVFGRDVEKNKIISWLKRPTQVHLSSFGIVGLGGLGKTTLAQFSYREMSGSNDFDKTIWICISNNFNVEDITRKMLKELGENSYFDKPLNALQETLKEKIHLKKIFLVLDDIWDDEKRNDWEKLIAPLRFVQEGSKILFTTRMKSVEDLLASVISKEHESLALQSLEEQDLRLLFYNYAFHGFNPDNHRDLQIFGDQILKMLRGSPLAAKVIGSLMNSHMDHHHWRRILNHGSIFNLEMAKNVMEVLKLSYYHLPADLQVCFRFCSIFPQDHKFDKDELIKMWMAVGIIRQQQCQGKEPEDIGLDYFNHLLRKSFFEYVDSWQGGRYIMHDLTHELAQNVSSGECCRIEPNDKSITIPSTVRHISVHESEIEKVFHLENLHSLVITTSEKTGTNPNLLVLPNNLIKKSLRLLKICGKYCELPEEISCLVHLRYLSIQSHDVTHSYNYLLRASVYKLYHLQVLEFPKTQYNSPYSGIEQTEMTNLLKLRYMRLPNEIMQTIHGVNKLTSLRELTFFVGQESGHRINELGTLKNLRHLIIENIENVGDIAEAGGANLLGMNNIMSLSLRWSSKSNPSNSEQIIGYLQPHPNLMKLTVENYKGQRSPSWMEQSPFLNLSSLKLVSCPIWKNQLFSWQMPYLQILDIWDCLNLDKLPNMPISLIEFRVHNVGLTSLPDLYQSSGYNTSQPLLLKSSLRVVKISKCPNLISLDGFLQQGNLDLQAVVELTISDCEELILVPVGTFGKLFSLKHLSIEDCENLTKCPNLPLSLTKFCINNVGMSALPEYYQNSDSRIGPSTSSLKSSLREVEIRCCSNLTALNGFLQQDNIDFQAAIIICIYSCMNLVHIPVSAFGIFVSLTELTISNCPMLVAVDNEINLLPTKLKDLKIENCGELDVSLLESASNLTSLTCLEIKNSENINRIPSTENSFISLIDLSIIGCDKLTKHSLMEKAHGADQGGSLGSLKINMLLIDNLCLLLIEPLRSLRFVSHLEVDDCSGMEDLPEQWMLQNENTLKDMYLWNASSIKSLPATMARFTSLKNLTIDNANLLEELPELPASIRSLSIRNARSLKSLSPTMTILTALEKLSIYDANRLKELPELPASLKVKKIGDSRGRWL